MIAAIALDLGSTSVKAGLLDQEGKLSNIVSQAVPVIHVEGGRYESDALSYAAVADEVLAKCLAQFTLAYTGSFPPLGLCSQRSSFLLWDKASGKPITPLISWQDNRGAESCAALHAHEPLITRLSGLRLTPYFFAPKLRVLLQENPVWREKLARGELLVGTLDTFLIWRWTDGEHHLTDVSMAARTLLLDVHEQQWSAALCDIFGIAPGVLPEIKPSTGWHLPLKNGLLLQASLADQSAALLASVGESREVALVNLGTGGFVIRYLQDDEHNAPAAYLRTLVYQNNGLPAHIAIEGTLNSIAAALAPYPVADCKVGELAAQHDIFCLAEPSGLGAPYFRNDLGLQFSSPVDALTQEQIACLLLEAIIFRVARILEDFQRSAAVTRVYLSGGLSELSSLQQGLALCLPAEVFRLQQKEASLQGAALLAAGVRYAGTQHAEKILVTRRDGELQEKYQRWKQWFDGLLKA